MLNELNEQQKEAVKAFDTPLLISAGAGSGKTRVITYKIAHIIREHGVPSYRILGMTFTNKAADVMKKRLTDILGTGRLDLWLGTFHSLCSRILKTEMEKPFIIIDENDKKGIVREIIREMDLDKEVYEPYTIATTISKLKNNRIPPHHHGSKAVTEEVEQVFRIYKKYEVYKEKAVYFDFDDLLIKTIRLLQTDAQVLGKYRDQFQYILVDEFQDTNDIQYELIYLLGHGHTNITAVGDPDQSIYSWRGANVHNFKKFTQDFQGCRTIKLEQNYRSPNIILKAATCVISHNSSYDNKKLWSRKGEGEKLKYFSGHFIDEESCFIREKIRELVRKGYAYKDIAVFCRTNYYYENLEFSLREENIPYRIIGGMKFFDRLEVRNVIAYLKFINNPRDDLSLLRIINIPNRGIGNKSLEKIGR
ncbi:MAG: UvrD-helicase domain-containing protein, partial [bacterium]|nr:UvrD-helicase domain-containing protein [bacterium]